MKSLLLVGTIVFTALMVCTDAFAWSTEAHNALIDRAFSAERADCLSELKAGSRAADGLAYQAPEFSYVHAMRRSLEQTVTEARALSATHIQGYYVKASQQKNASTRMVNATPLNPWDQLTSDGKLITDLPRYLASCRTRGFALHPVMDSTSPAHLGYEVWSLGDLEELFEHGETPASFESRKELFKHADLMNKTVALMQILDELYLGLGQFSFRFEL
jgi:hypothetical protein